MQSENKADRFALTTASLDRVGRGMCLSKWSELYLHLGKGHNHSCHHPISHKVSVEEITENPSALHNSSYKKTVRSDMLKGKRPQECNFCHIFEDNLRNEGSYSDRIAFSSRFRDLDEYLGKIIRSGATADWNPNRIEVSFGNKCNFRCHYCEASTSSSWMKELELYGPYPIESSYGNTIETIRSQDKMPIPQNQPNPYIDAWWKWIPDVYPHLVNLRVTGGEPLLSADTFRMMDWVYKHPNPNLELGINSNLGVPTKVFNRFIEKSKRLVEKNHIKCFDIWTSCEAANKQAEYIRDGIDYSQWLSNVRAVLDNIPGCKIKIMTTYCAMSVVGYSSFLDDVFKLVEEYGDRVWMDSHNYLQHPRFLAIDILDEEFVPYIEAQTRYMKDAYGRGVAFELQVLQAQRLEDYFKNRLTNPWRDVDVLRRDFAAFVDEHDKRRGTDFLATFPEMKAFYERCKYREGRS